MSQEALAYRAGMSLRAFRSLETGEAGDPHYSTLSKLAAALDMSVAELTGEETAASSARPLDEIDRMSEEELVQRKIDLEAEVQELSKLVPLPVIVQRNLKLKPIRHWTAEDWRNSKRQVRASAELNRIYRRLEAEAGSAVIENSVNHSS